MRALLCLLLGAWVLAGRAMGVVELQQGRYSGLTVAFSSDMAEPDNPDQLVQLVQDFVTAGSASLSTGVSGGLSFADATILIPRSWNASNIGTVNSAAVDLNSKTADIFIDDSLETSLPSTLQAELCGVPGRQITLPLSFLNLTAEQQQQYGTPGSILAHEWAHYRWGVHDEHGWGGDNVYNSADESEQVTACAQGDTSKLGVFRRDCAQEYLCNPGGTDCFFCYYDNVTSSDVKASLGYLPALSLGQFCNASTHVRHTTTPQNVLCGQRSIMEVLEQHPDYTQLAEATTATEVQMSLVQETFGRVLFLLNTPTAGATNQVSYAAVMEDLRETLLSHGYVEMAITSYKSDGTESINNALPFTRVTADTYDSLTNSLPVEENGLLVPDLAVVLQQVVDQWEAFPPGSLVVLPVTNELVLASTLDRALGESLHALRIKPLLVYPDQIPEVAHIVSFIQYSGARLVYNGESSAEEIQKFLDYGFVNDHPIVKEDTHTLKKGESFESAVYYQEDVARTRIAAVVASSVADLTVSYVKFGTYRECDICNTTSTTILFLQRTTGMPIAFPGTAWKLLVTNNGASDIDIAITWSEEYFIGKTDELDVQVWLSDGRQPVAPLPENQNMVLYASVSNYGKSVLQSRVSIKADVTIRFPNASVYDLNVDLTDYGNETDIKQNDCVYSVDLTSSSTGIIPTGTTISVNTLYVLGNNPVGSPLRAQHSPSRKRSRQSSGLLPRDPSEEECCGSFVESLDDELTQNSKGFHLILRDVATLGTVPGSGAAASSITLQRDIDLDMEITTITTTTTTTTPTTTTTTTTTPTTTTTTTTTPTTKTTTQSVTTPTSAPTTEGHGGPITTITTKKPTTGDKGGAASLFLQSTGVMVIILGLIQVLFLQ